MGGQSIKNRKAMNELSVREHSRKCDLEAKVIGQSVILMKPQ